MTSVKFEQIDFSVGAKLGEFSKVGVGIIILQMLLEGGLAKIVLTYAEFSNLDRSKRFFYFLG
jgi:hypothetical protein